MIVLPCRIVLLNWLLLFVLNIWNQHTNINRPRSKNLFELLFKLCNNLILLQVTEFSIFELFLLEIVLSHEVIFHSIELCLHITALLNQLTFQSLNNIHFQVNYFFFLSEFKLELFRVFVITLYVISVCFRLDGIFMAILMVRLSATDWAAAIPSYWNIGRLYIFTLWFARSQGSRLMRYRHEIVECSVLGMRLRLEWQRSLRLWLV